MIPRLQARGTSFKGSCKYVLNDKKAETKNRVAWTVTQNLHCDPEDAWWEMCETHRNQDILKRNAGISARGRKNTAPVLHYTLAWHADDEPSADEMQKAARDSLKVLGMAEHEALIVGHNDTRHPHVHVVANTVHPYTGRTAELKYSKERLSSWAEEYEREHGRIRCEERVKNNEKRQERRHLRDEERLKSSFARATGQEPPAPKAYMPIKDSSENRPQWFEKKEIVDRMKRLRAELDLQHKVERGVTSMHHRIERDALEANSKAAIDNARNHVRERYRPQWRELYKSQGREQRFIAKSATHPFERAAFVYRNRERLGHGKPLTFRKMFGLIVSGKKLSQAVEAAHQRERRALASESKTNVKQLTERIWTIHREKFHTLCSRQYIEVDAERSHHRIETREITLARAKNDLMREFENMPLPRPVPRPPKRDHPAPTQEFNEAAWQPLPDIQPQALSRAEQIRRDMEVWRRNNGHRDLGREF